MPHSGPYTGEWTSKRIRSMFFDYFKERGHTYVPSSSTIPYDDPTLLFANAGMNQFKSIFLGTVDPQSDLSKLKRAFNSQKCIRAGGKHNGTPFQDLIYAVDQRNVDLEDVGRDSYHHTMFEMLGNWSFGDYFKKEAIQYSWELLTSVFNIPKDRLYVTYYEGDSKTGLGPDLEARQIWLDLGVPEDHVLPGSAKDNFWEMGATGPCGPCSEIHYDRIGGRNAANIVNQDDPNVIEIWNNVFITYNRETDGSLRTLPAQHVDTGMGFERLVSVIQDRWSNYDTDVFTPIFDRIQQLTGVRPHSGKFGVDDVDGIDTAYRVVADHTRTLAFALSDGGVPDNVGRGYVLRRILRRGSRYARKRLGVNIGTFFSSLLPVVVEQMGDVFPELTKKTTEIKEILDEEEESFSRTLDRGEKLFDGYVTRAKHEGFKELNGRDVWRLYDTYGFPVDLTRLMAEELGLNVNEEEFERAQAHSKEASKGLKKGDEKLVIKLDVHDIGALEKNDTVPKTDDLAKFGVGTINANVKAIYRNKEFLNSTSEIPEGEPFGVILDKTNLYAESGGQENDTGSIVIDGEAEFAVEDVQVFNGYVLHIGHMKYGQLDVDAEVVAYYDELRRWPLRNNHTATHILNWCLRETLGDHIDQRGSLVAPTKLRFDFSHKAQIAVPDLKKIEKQCNEWVARDAPVYSKELSLQAGYKIPGLRAVFGEAYPDPVRVVTLDYSIDQIAKDLENPKWRSTSIEFCGGTHVSKTGEIKDIIITEESGIAKGIRRIIAVTGHEAQDVMRTANSLTAKLKRIESLSGKEKDAELRTYIVELGESDISVLRKADLRDRFNKARKSYDDEVKAREKASTKQLTNDLTVFFKENPGADNYIADVGAHGNPKILQAVVLQGKKLGKAVYVFSADRDEGKVAHACFLPEAVSTKTFNAQTWSASVSEIIGGRAGGKGDSSQGVGTNVDLIESALKKAKDDYSGRT